MITLEFLERALGNSLDGYPEPTFDCPFCRLRGHSTDPGHIHISIEKGVALCHRCGYKSRNLKSLIFQATGEIPANITRDMRKSGVSLALKEMLTKIKKEEPKADKLQLPEEYIPLTFPVRGMVAKRMWKYIKGRGISKSQVEDANIGYACGGYFFGMLIFPIYIGNVLRFITSRDVMGMQEAKTLHSKVDRDGVVFNYNAAASAKRVFITEGPFDALSWGDLGVGVGTLGHTLHPSQARVLSYLPAEEFIFCYDAGCVTDNILSAKMMAGFTSATVTYMLLPYRCSKCGKAFNKKILFCDSCSNVVLEGDPNSEREFLPDHFRGRKIPSLTDVLRLQQQGFAVKKKRKRYLTS